MTENNSKQQYYIPLLFWMKAVLLLPDYGRRHDVKLLANTSMPETPILMTYGTLSNREVVM